MKPKKRQKLCFNCEGEIDLDVIVCPFCAADLREEKPEQNRAGYNPAASVKHLGRTETADSLYPPHFPASPPKVEAEALPAETVVDEPQEENSKNIFAATALLTLGVQLCLFGLLIALFSHKGVLLLKWNARFWFLYLFASTPLLYFGYRSLAKI